MHGLFRETFFGRLVHTLSGGKFFQRDEQIDPSRLEPYMPNQSFTTSEQTIAPSTNANTLQGRHSVSSEKSNEASNDGSTPPSKIDPEKGTDWQLVTWLEHDPEYPRNWSRNKKVFVTFQICLLTISVYIGSAIYTAGLQGIMQKFHVSQVVSLLGLTLFVLGYAIGPMILAPMSEMPYFGRNPIYIITLLCFVVLQLAVIYAKNIGMLLAFRFITGFIGSPVLATGGATIADMYTPKKQVYGIAVWGISAVCGPALGPVIGGFAAQHKGWQWPIWELMWLSGFCFVVLFFFLPETGSSNILYRRTVQYRKLTGNQKLKCEAEIEAEGMTGKDAAMMILVRPFTLSFFEPIVFFLNLYIALIYALLYLWFESFPIVFGIRPLHGIYGFTLSMEGLSFLGILIGAFVVIGPFVWYYRTYMEPLFNENDEIKPEYRLRPSLVGCFFIPICLFWFGWSARPSIHWIMPIIGSSYFTIGAFLMFMSVLSYLGDAYPKYVASVYASNDLVRSAFGAAFPLFGSAMYNNLGVGWASSLLGFLSIAFIPIPYVLYFHGEKIRKRSKMARHDL